MSLKEGKRKVVNLSYDDGVVQDIKLIKIMDKYGIKGTFNINSGMFLPEDKTLGEIKGHTSERLKLSEAKKLYIGSGHEVAVHGYKHLYLTRISLPEVVYEITKDRLNLEEEFGCIAKGMAYAYGAANDEIVDCLKKCGILYSRVTGDTKQFIMPDNWLMLHPTCHHAEPRLNELVDEFLNAPLKEVSCEVRMFYLWGHSYEFDSKNNWDVIENFCKTIGNKEDVWYATNMEIYNYVNAYNSLYKSMDGTKVYNPSAIEVYFRENGKTYSVKPGETIKL